jgi:predicted amidophosphoribosyltransferase
MEDIQREKDEQDAMEMATAMYEERMRSDDMAKCSVCECWVNKDDMTCGVCESCIDDIITRTTVDEVAEYASTLDEKDELVLYTQYLFNTRQAIEILKEHAKSIKSTFLFRNDIREYIENDTGDYLDYLKEKGAL